MEEHPQINVLPAVAVPSRDSDNWQAELEKLRADLEGPFVDQVMQNFAAAIRRQIRPCW